MTGFNFSQGGGNTDLSATTATAADVRKGAVFFDNTGNETIGTMPEEAGKTIIPSTGELTAITQGKLAAGDIKVAAVPTQSKTVTPTNSRQTILPDTGKFLSSVVVNAMSGNGGFISGIVECTNTDRITIPVPSGQGFTLGSDFWLCLVYGAGVAQSAGWSDGDTLCSLWADNTHINTNSTAEMICPSRNSNKAVVLRSGKISMSYVTGSNSNGPYFTANIDENGYFYRTGQYYYIFGWKDKE